MRIASADERVSSGVWPGLFWSLVEPLMSLMETRARAGRHVHGSRVRLPDARSSTSWAVRGLPRPAGAAGTQQDPPGSGE